MVFGNNSDRDWNQFGEDNRYYWVTTFGKYRDDHMTDDRWSEFFAESSSYVGKLLQTISMHVDPHFRIRRALDFGCGIGRVSLPLAEVATHVIGLDISDGMLDEARENSRKQGGENLGFFKSDDDLSAASGTFNFIHSIYVFQHIPFVRGKAIVKKMLSILEDGGVLALHFLLSNDLSLRRKVTYWMQVHIPLVKNLLNLRRRQKWSAPMMQLNSYPLNDLIDLMNAEGCVQYHLRYTKDGRYNGVMILAQKKKSESVDFVDLGLIP